MSLKVLLVTGIFPPDLGGPATFNSKFALWAVTQDFQIQVLTYSNLDFVEQSDSRIKIIRINRNQNILFRYLKMITMIIVQGLKCDVILANGCFIELSISKLILIRPVITKIPGDPLWERARNNRKTKLGIREFQDENRGLLQKVLRFLTSKSIVSSNFVITPSKELATLVTHWGVSPEKIKIIPNAVDVNKFVPPVTRIIKFDVVTVARLVHWKGVAELIEVCADLNLSLAVIGDGPELMSLQTLAQVKNSRVRFFGSLSQRESIDVMVSSSIFVLNSEYEGFPHALIEAMALEILCIARAGTGCDEIIHDGVNGFLVTSGSTTKSLRCVLERAKSEEYRVDIRKAARRDVIQNFHHEKTYNSISFLLQKAGLKSG